MTRDNNKPSRRALLELPAALALGMVLLAAMLAKGGYPLLALGAVAGFQILYPLAGLVAPRGLELIQRVRRDARMMRTDPRRTTLASGKIASGAAL